MWCRVGIGGLHDFEGPPNDARGAATSHVSNHVFLSAETRELAGTRYFPRCEVNSPLLVAPCLERSRCGPGRRSGATNDKAPPEARNPQRTRYGLLVRVVTCYSKCRLSW